MNFDFSEDQKMLKEQVSKFLSDNCSLDVARDILESDKTYSEEVWRGLVDLGLTGTAIPEEYGGLGLGALELCVVAEVLWFSRSICSLELISTFALPETNSEPTEKNIKTTFSNGKINGRKIPVADGSCSDIAIVVVKNTDNDHIALTIVDLTSENVKRNQISTLDPSRDHAEIIFNNTPSEIMNSSGDGWSDVQQILDIAAVLISFEQIG